MMKGKQKVVEVRNYIESYIFEYGSFVKIQRPKYRIKSHIHTMHAAPPLSGGTSLARNKQTRFVPFEATFFFFFVEQSFFISLEHKPEIQVYL